jgi:sugar phosphate isomerase/epimerase
MAVLLGHTLGTPNLALAEALDLFAASGLDGAEIIWQDDYPAAIPESDDGSAARAAERQARDLGLQIGCLTPYITELNSLDEEIRRRDAARMQTCIRTAESLGCARVRVYGGALGDGEPEAQATQKWARMIDSLRELGDYAVARGVVLCIENHFSTMTVSAADTARLVADTGSGGVGILYDQANLTFTHSEPFDDAIRIQAPWIRHVHVKDLEFIDPNRRLRTAAVSYIAEADRVHRSRMIGDGILDWAAIIERLRLEGYDGTYSLEYEYRWNPQDLPEPATGFPESAHRLREAFRRATAAGMLAAEPTP